jgi:hypothetical protein
LVSQVPAPQLLAGLIDRRGLPCLALPSLLLLLLLLLLPLPSAISEFRKV